jgi:hypothetical protein
MSQKRLSESLAQKRRGGGWWKGLGARRTEAIGTDPQSWINPNGKEGKKIIQSLRILALISVWLFDLLPQRIRIEITCSHLI